MRNVNTLISVKSIDDLILHVCEVDEAQNGRGWGCAVARGGYEFNQNSQLQMQKNGAKIEKVTE